MQMGVRAYGPELGRFLSEDPVLGQIGRGSTLSRHGYGLGDPIGNYDLDGRCVVDDVPFVSEACDTIGGTASDAADWGISAAGDAGEWGLGAAADAAEWGFDAAGDALNGLQDFVKEVADLLPSINCGTVSDVYAGAAYVSGGAAVALAPFTSGASTAALGGIAVGTRGLSTIFRDASDSGTC